MKLKISLIGIILIIIAISGCIGNNEQLKKNDSSVSNVTSITAYNSDKISSNYDANGFCTHIVDGDTIDVDGIGRVRLVGINTPEENQRGYHEAKDFVKKTCLGKRVYLDIDNAKYYDKYGRVLAVVYVDKVNVNSELLKRGYAKIMYIPPSEFNPYSWI